MAKEKYFEIEISKNDLKKFSNPKEVNKYIDDFNTALSTGNDFKNARREADRRNSKMEERSKTEIDAFISVLNVNILKGEKPDYKKAIEKVADTQSMTAEEIKIKMDEQITQMKETLKKLEKLRSAIPIKTETLKPAKEKKVEIEMLALTFPFGNNNSYKVYLIDHDSSIQKQFMEAKNDNERKYVLEANKYSIYKSETIFDIGTNKEIRKDVNRQETIVGIEQKGALFNLKIGEIKREKVKV